jgi:hypothetical protein
MRDVIGRQPRISIYSITERGIDIILSLNTQQECILSLIIVEKIAYIFKTTDSNATNISKLELLLRQTFSLWSMQIKITT